MSDEIKRMNIKEFRENGYLQELNRRFLHPLGLALEIVIYDETNEEKLGGIWDYRDDPEGIYYDLKNSDQERINRFIKNKQFIDEEFNKRKDIRVNNLGYQVEDIPIN